MAKKKKEKKDNIVHIGEKKGTAEEFENKEIRGRVLEFRDKVEENFWEFSIILAEIYDGALYKAWGFDTWKDYVGNELDFSLRKAQQLVRLQSWYAKLPPNVQKWVRGMGWTKSRLLTGKLTAENAKMWKDRLDGKTRAEMKEIMDQMSGGGEDEGGEGSGSSGGSQSVDTAKRLSFSLFAAQHENVQSALEKAKKYAESEKPGHLLDLICTEWIAQTVGVENEVDYLAQVEALIGLKLVAYDEAKDIFIYGEELMRQFEVDDEEETEGEQAEA